MPIRVGSALITPTPPPVPTVRERWSITYTAPDGSVWPMTTRALNYWVMKGAIAFGATPISITADPNPRGGETPRNFQYLRRLLTWPVNVQGKTHQDFIDLWRALGDAFTMTTEQGPGLLTVTQPDGSSRMIQVYYQDGWQETQPEAGWKADAAVMTLYAPEPWWLDTKEVVIERKYTGSGSSYFVGFPHLSSSQTLASTTVFNPGEVGVWPDWEIDGPATGVTAIRYMPNGTDIYGQFTLSGSWDLGETVTLKSDPQEILGPDGSSWVDKLDWPGADLFSLPRGTTKVAISVSGSSAGTAARMRFFPRRATG